METLFPRLHVNDTEKGGPRSPPRNKMALYEQLSVPSQRLSRPSSALQLPYRNTCMLVPSDSSSQGYGHEIDVLYPFCMPRHMPVYLSEKVDSQSSNGIYHNSLLEERSLKHGNSRNLNVTGSVAQCSPLQHYKSKSFYENKLDDVDDFRVPTFNQSEAAICSKKDTPILHLILQFNAQQKIPYSTLNSSIQCSTSHRKPFGQTDTANKKSRNFGGSEKMKQPEESLVIALPRERSPTARVPERPIVSKVLDSAILRDVEKSPCGDTGSCREPYGNDDLSGPRTSNVENGDASQKRHRTPNDVDSCNLENSVKENGSLGVGDAERKDETSEASMDDSLSGLEISLDDVVGIVGPKHFFGKPEELLSINRGFLQYKCLNCID